jgi:hypothetical protein
VLAVAVAGLTPSVNADLLDFRAEVDDHTTKAAGCPAGAVVCGEATIAGYGTGEYLYVLTSVTPLPGACDGSFAGGYAAIVTFTLADGSELTLDEAGHVCGPGESLIAPGGLVSYGNPVEGVGAWDVAEATGRFAGLTGSGTNTFRSAGARIVATYVGKLEG